MVVVVLDKIVEKRLGGLDHETLHKFVNSAISKIDIESLRPPKVVTKKERFFFADVVRSFISSITISTVNLNFLHQKSIRDSLVRWNI